LLSLSSAQAVGVRGENDSQLASGGGFSYTSVIRWALWRDIPWNAPITSVVWQLARCGHGALWAQAGEPASLNSLRFAELVLDFAGFPPGVGTLVRGAAGRPARAGGAFPGVDQIAFTALTRPA